MWIGNSEKNLHQLFDRARRAKPCVLFFDEVDALAASRADMRTSGGRHLINQFLAELDGVTSNNDGVLILAAAFSQSGLGTRLTYMMLLRVVKSQPLLRMRMGCSELPQVKQGGCERPVRLQPVPGVPTVDPAAIAMATHPALSVA